MKQLPGLRLLRLRRWRLLDAGARLPWLLATCLLCLLLGSLVYLQQTPSPAQATGRQPLGLEPPTPGGTPNTTAESSPLRELLGLLPRLPPVSRQVGQLARLYRLQRLAGKSVAETEELIQAQFQVNASQRPVEFEQANREFCRRRLPADAELRLTIVVKSRLESHESREQIRRSWGAAGRFDGISVSTAFAVGSCAYADAGCAARLDQEQRRHRDLIQGAFHDTYDNNTLKTVMALRWHAEHCAQSDYLVIGDDDYYVSTKNLLIYLRQRGLLGKPLPAPLLDGRFPLDVSAQQLYAGTLLNASSPFRDRSNKWYVGTDEYGYALYPDYVTGGFTLFSRRTALELYYASLYVPRFRIDDVYVGLLARHLDVLPSPLPNCYLGLPFISKRSFEHLLCLHGLKNIEMVVDIWRYELRRGNA